MNPWLLPCTVGRRRGRFAVVHYRTIGEGAVVHYRIIGEGGPVCNPRMKSYTFFPYPDPETVTCQRCRKCKRFRLELVKWRLNGRRPLPQHKE